MFILQNVNNILNIIAILRSYWSQYFENDYRIKRRYRYTDYGYYTMNT